jgi:hypothetical protein
MQSRSLISRWRGAGFTGALLFCTAGALPAAGLLEDEQVDSAEPATLSAEVQTLDDIGKGVALSLAQCEAAGAAEACKPAVTEDELRELATRLDTRITQVATRYSRTNEGALEDIAVGYSEVRGEYTQYLEKLAELGSGPAGGEDIFTDEPAPAEEAAPAGEEEIEDLFSDTDEEL